jgi:glycosyltransferase involved in cell wall biosynthesis
VVKFYQSLDVFCLSSRNEGFPLATLEAQSCDIVTIAGNVGAVNETLSPSASHLVSHLEAEEFATAIYNEMQTPSQTSPRHFVKQNNDIRQMIQAYRHLTQPMESLL